MKVVVIGHPEAVQGFALVGVQGIIALDKASVNAALDQVLADKTIGIVMLTSRAVEQAPERVSQLRSQTDLPVFIEIPGPGGMTQNRNSLVEVANQAIGIMK